MFRRCVPLWVVMCVSMMGCFSAPQRVSNVSEKRTIADLIDPSLAKHESGTVPILDHKIIQNIVTQQTEVPEGRKPYNMLVLSGGGAYGAFSAGLLAGWSESGTRPDFDVVTGVSTGALVATFAFLGPSKDPILKHFYTTATDRDIYSEKTEIFAVFSDSLTDSEPLRKAISFVIDEKLLQEIASEHKKGRRLYVGTTHLDSRRLVVWDMGAMAVRGDLKLFQQVLLASASIPGFFPPVDIDVTVDGENFHELHVDGGVTASLFWRPPVASPEVKAQLGDKPLAGSNLYIIVAGKLYADPGVVKQRLLPIVSDAISALLYSQTRGDLFQLFALAQATSMNYRLTSVPMEVNLSKDATSFKPVEMTELFTTGFNMARQGKAWRPEPPGARPGEEPPLRSGSTLVTKPSVKVDRGVVTVGAKESTPHPSTPKLPSLPVQPEKIGKLFQE